MEGPESEVLPSEETVTVGVRTILKFHLNTGCDLAQNTNGWICLTSFDLCQHALADPRPVSHLIQAHTPVLTKSL